jgi:hypothetical protein
MPMKRRLDKRRPTVPSDAWFMAFETGFDLYEELKPAGVIEPTRIQPGPEREAADAAWMAALRAAWAKHGDAFFAARDPREADRVPWALEQFGDPTPCR